MSFAEANCSSMKFTSFIFLKFKIRLPDLLKLWNCFLFPDYWCEVQLGLLLYFRCSPRYAMSGKFMLMPFGFILGTVGFLLYAAGLL